MAALSKERRRFLESTTLQYQKNLSAAESWLAGRGIDLDRAQYEGLGVVTDPPALHEDYRGMLAIPYLTESGPVNMVFRCIEDGCVHTYHGKYNKMHGWGANLYGMRTLRVADDWIAITEGEIDSIILRHIGIPAIAIPGAENWKSHWSNVLEDFSKVYVYRDGDAAGKDMFKRIRKELDLPVIEVDIPDDEDVNSLYLAGAEKWLKEQIRE